MYKTNKTRKLVKKDKVFPPLCPKGDDICSCSKKELKQMTPTKKQMKNYTK
jgi:hypothetical protein